MQMMSPSAPPPRAPSIFAAHKRALVNVAISNVLPVSVRMVGKNRVQVKHLQIVRESRITSASEFVLHH
jgi:hypothetical protein